jgi:N-formylmaleamate deformylase
MTLANFLARMPRTVALTAIAASTSAWFPTGTAARTPALAPASVSALEEGRTPGTGERADSAFRVERVGQGPPMILIPGMTSSGDVWRGTVDHYRDRYELHVLTLAGFAGVPPLDDGPFLPTVRDALIDYIRTEGLDAPTLVGHSLGGFLAFSIAVEAPELVGPVVAVDGVPFLVALNDPSASAESMAGQAEQMRQFYTTLTPEQMEAQARMAAAGMATDPAHVDEITRWGRDSSPVTAGRAFAEMLTTDLRDDVSAIRTPVLVFMAGGAFPESALDGAAARYQSQVEAVPAAEVAVARDARHFIRLDDPDFFLSTLDRFLEDHR